MAEPLTPIERKVYQYLIDFLTENTYQTSIREIGRKFRIKSTKTVSDLLHSLTQKGFIERDPSRSRGVRILGYSGPMRTQPVPYYGKIHAGEPALLPESREGYVTFDRRFVPGEDAEERCTRRPGDRSSFAYRIGGERRTGGPLPAAAPGRGPSCRRCAPRPPRRRRCAVR